MPTIWVGVSTNRHKWLTTDALFRWATFIFSPNKIRRKNIQFIIKKQKRIEMNLIIDGISVTARPDQSLLDIAKELGMIKGKLSTDPIAAKIAGEVFTLNYIPLRRKDTSTERESVRRAMAASNGIVRFLRYSDPKGRDVYTRTAQFVIFLALRQLYPEAHAKMNCTVGAGLYIKVLGAENFSAEKLKERVGEIVDADIPLVRRRITTKEALEYYSSTGQDDKARLLGYRESPTLDIYEYGEFSDYFYGEIAPSTSFLRVWDILDAPDGFMFVFPDSRNPDRVAEYHELPNLLSVYMEGKNWC